MNTKILSFGLLGAALFLAVGCTKKSDTSTDLSSSNATAFGSTDSSAKPSDTLVLPKGMGTPSGLLNPSVPGPRESMGNIQPTLGENKGDLRKASKLIAKHKGKKHGKKHGRRHGRRHR